MNKQVTKSVMPNFILFGAMKSGTSSVYEYLKQHPDIFMSPIKEPDFFAFEETKNLVGPGVQEWCETNIIKDLKSYQKLFEGYKEEKVIGEASPFYICFDKSAVNIKKYIPNTKLIAILRNPADRAFSNYIYAIITGGEDFNSFQDALAAENQRIEKKWAPKWHYKTMGFYYRQLKPYVEICVSQNGLFIGDPTYKNNKSTKEMKFGDFIHLLKLNRNSKDIYYYLAQASIPKLSPKLIQDIELPVYCENTLLNDSLINLWLGSGGNTSVLHFDRADNLLAQVRGRKRFILFAPQQTAFLYPFPVNCPTPHFSQINIDQPDLTKFPKFTRAKSFEVILEAGEMLFIPAFWWHQVYSLDGGFPIISVNFWCKVPMWQWLTPPGRRYAREIPVFINNKFWKWRKRLTKKIKTKLKLDS